jgi:predicted phosphodiesterase
MRVAVVSDIHGNRRALKAVLADLRDVAPDVVLHGGDLAAGGTHPAEVIDQIRALGWAGVRGNTDEMLWAPERLTAYAVANPKIAALLAMVEQTIAPTVASIGEERLRWLQGLPQGYVGEGFALVHASPDDLWRAPMANASDDELAKTYGSLGAPVVVYGHIHVPYVRRVGSMTVANTGSVSQSYDGDTRASYLVIDGLPDGASGSAPGRALDKATDRTTESAADSVKCSIRRVEYDVQAEAEDLLRSGLPQAEWMARILLAGRYVAPQSGEPH